jgi:signal transduction histidine kinase
MRRRITLAIVGVAAAAVLALALPLAIGAAQLYRDDELLSLERDATAAARSFDARAAPGDPIEFALTDDEVAAYDRAGRLLGGDGPASADAVAERTLATGRVSDLEASGHLVVAVPIVARERVVGAIRASRSTAEVSDRILRMRLTIAGAAALIIGLAAIAAAGLTRRLIRPVRELAAAAAAIEGGQSATAAPRSGIPELDTVSEALDETAARLGEVLARERAFSANASHQLRTPLAALRLELEARSLRGADVADPLREVDRLEATIETMLAAARDLPRVREPIDVAAILEDVRREWTGSLAKAGRRLEIAIPLDIPRAKATPGAVHEILGILVDNATRHGTGTVRVALRNVDSFLAIDVADEGKGVGDPTQIFARRSGSGHGIGLSLARALAEADGGRLDLTDSTGIKTTFTLLLSAEKQQ